MGKKAKRWVCRILVLCMILSVGSTVLPPPVEVMAATESRIGGVDDYAESGEDGNVLVFHSEKEQIRIELCTARTVRVQLSLDGEDGYRPEDPEYYMVQKNEWAPVKKTVTDRGDYIEIQTDALELRVQKDPFRVAMYDRSGNLLSKDADDQGIYWDNAGVRGVKKEEGTRNAGGIFGFGSGDHGRRSNLNRYNMDFNEFSMSHGRVVAPFFMSTVGYGMFLNTIEKDTVFFKRGGGFQTKGYLDYYFMYGPDFKTILNEYAEITGRMELYGKWAHGFMLSKYGNDNATQAEFLQWLHKLRDDGYPCDCYVFDYGWRGDVADNGGNQSGAGQKWGKQMWSNDKNKFPDIAAMFAEADALGFRVGLHNNAGTPEAKGGKELYKPENEAVWVKSYMDSVITTGFGDWFWPDEFDVLGSNTAPTFSSKGAYEAWQEYTVESRPMFVTRGSYGGQHFATAWSGDINPDSSELLNQIGFSIDTGLIGYWTTSHDLGGFMKRPSNELYTRWVSEFGAWNGIMRTHGHDGREPWTFDATAQETLKQNLKIRYALYPYTYSLAWQGYSQGVPMMRAMLLEDGSQYNPAAWNLNKQYYYGDWFLVAPAADTKDTVVSVWLPPNTTWYDYYTGERYEGGESGKTILVAAALDEIPVFVKAGAIVPMGPELDYADEVPLDPLTLDIYPKGESSFTLYEDDGVSRRYITENAYTTTKFDCVESGDSIQFTVHARKNGNASVYTPDDRSYNLKFNHVASLGGVTVNGVEISEVFSLEEYNGAAEAYWLDGEHNVVYVKTKDTGAKIEAVLSDTVIAEPEAGKEEEALPAQKIEDGDRFELEEAEVMTGGVKLDDEWKGYTGKGFAKGFQSVGASVEFRVDIQKAGDYDLVLKVNNGKKNNPKYDNTPREGTLYLDEKPIAEMKFKVTDVWGNTVNSVKQGVWVDYTVENVPLGAGVHTFKFVAEGKTNPGNYNLDSLTFKKIDRSVDAFTKIEAETARELKDVSVADDSGASGGKKLETTVNGASVEFAEVRGENKSSIELGVRSSTGGRIIVYENGVGDKILASLTVPVCDDWTVLETQCKDTDVATSNIFFEFLADGEGDFRIEMDYFRFREAVKSIGPDGIYELEDGEGKTNDAGNALRIDKEWKGYSGAGYVAGWKKKGDYVEFEANVLESGTYDLLVNAGCGKKNDPRYDSTDRTGALYINGEKTADFGIPVTPTWGDKNKNGDWNLISIGEARLEAGVTKFKIVSEGDVNPGNFNLDYLKFVKLADKKVLRELIARGKAYESDRELYTEKSFEALLEALEQAEGLLADKNVGQAAVDSAGEALLNAISGLKEKIPSIRSGSIFELEDGAGKTNEAGNALRIDKEWKGYSGTGYVAGWKKPGDYVEFDVNILEAGKYRLLVHAGCGAKGGAFDASDRTGALYVGGAKAADFGIPVTPTWGDGSKNGDWNLRTIGEVSLDAGVNRIKICSEGNVNPGNFNLDYVQFIRMYTVTAASCDEAMGTVSLTPQADAYALGENVTVSAQAADGYEFVSWTVGGVNVSGEEEYSFVVDSDTVITANFKEIPAPADKTALETLIGDASGYEGALDSYTEESRQAFETALATARAVMADENATEEMVQEACDALRTAVLELKETVDLSVLKALIAEAEQRDVSNCTEDSAAALAEALTAARAVAENPAAVQKTVNEAAARLQSALDGLEMEQISVIFQDGTADGSREILVPKGSLLTRPEDPVREGYTFLGWYRGDEAYDFGIPVTGALILSAKWELREPPVEPEKPEDPSDPEEPTKPEEPENPNVPENPDGSGGSGTQTPSGNPNRPGGSTQTPGTSGNGASGVTRPSGTGTRVPTSPTGRYTPAAEQIIPRASQEETVTQVAETTTETPVSAEISEEEVPLGDGVPQEEEEPLASTEEIEEEIVPLASDAGAKKTWVWIPIALTGCALAGGGVFLAVRLRGKKKRF